VLLLGLPALGCATTSDLRQLENRVATLSGGEVGEQVRTQLADLTARVDALNREVDELRGSLEVANHRADQALEEARRARQDADSAARGGAAPARAYAPEGGMPEDGGAPPPAAPGGMQPEIENSPGALSVQNYSASPYADDALYWMADCYYKQGDQEKAILRFAKVVEMYPTGNKAPDALYRQGEVLLNLGPSYSNAARDVFQRVLAEYPDSPRADEAQRQLERLSAG
jgi:tol-pal system protein YbgF